MANVYQQYAAEGAQNGWVRYSIEPDFGQPVYPGDIVTINGEIYSREFAVKSIQFGLGLQTNSGIFGTTINTSIGKGKTGKFVISFSTPKFTARPERTFQLYARFSSFDMPDGIYKNGGYTFQGVEECKMSYLKYKIAPNVSDMDFERADENGTWSNEGLYFRCRLFKMSISADANASDITIAQIKSEGSEGSESIVTLNSAQIQSALSEEGYTELLPDVFKDASLLGATYTLTLTIGDNFEQVVYTDTVPRAFANIHLSGAKTGGVALGMFSTATEGEPKFESAYPAYFYAGFGDETIKMLGNVLYPVGSIFMCSDDVSPIDIFGGKWEQIKDKFLVSSGDTYQFGDTGGQDSYNLYATHNHLSPVGTSSGLVGVAMINGSLSGGKGWPYASSIADYSGGSLSSNISLGYTSDAAVSANIPTIPPYYSVCVWKRTELYNAE